MRGPESYPDLSPELKLDILDKVPLFFRTAREVDSAIRYLELSENERQEAKSQNNVGLSDEQIQYLDVLLRTCDIRFLFNVFEDARRGHFYG